MIPFSNSVQLSKIEKGYGGDMGSSTTGRHTQWKEINTIANLFTCYCLLITDSIPSSIMLSGFADDHSIRISFPAKCHTVEERTISTMENTLTRIANWMTSMQLKLNSEKTKFILFGSRQMLRHTDTLHLNFGTTPIQ